MTPTKPTILYSIFLILMTTSFGISANANSYKDAGKGFHNLGGTKNSGDSSSNIRFKRMSTYDEIDKAGNNYRADRLLNNVDENLGDDTYNGQDFGYDLDKKASSFVRIGRMLPMNRFIRIGRFYGNAPTSNGPTYDDISGEEKRASHFVRIGKSPSSFVRIGKAYTDDDNDDGEGRFDKRASSFVRIGKSFESPSDPAITFLDNLKRASHFVRFGGGPSSFVRIGKSPSSFARIGQSPSSFVRIGKSQFGIDDKRGSSFVRIGKDSNPSVAELSDYSDKRASSFVRIGKSDNNDRDLVKRASSFVRIGKSTDTDRDVLKRVSSFVRIGKSPDYDRDLLKRVSSFVRIGKSTDNDTDLLKRVSSFVRIGKSPEEDKRTSSFVRIGKSENSGDNDKDKRISSFVRIGKSGLSANMANELDKRVSSFVRIGKSLDSDNSLLSPASPVGSLSSSLESLTDDNLSDDEEPIRVANRGSAFVRIGKIPSSAFVRIGKNKNPFVQPVEYNRGFQGNQSSFVRIGK